MLALVFCASGFADPSKNVVTSTEQQTTERKVVVCYVKTITSGIPQRCTRYLTGTPTTASPIVVIGQAK